MLKKVFLQTQFGTPHTWTREFFDNIAHLEKDGWYLKVFTENQYDNVPANVEIVKMSLQEFDNLIIKYCGVDPKNYLENGVPHKFVSDYYPAYGLIFQDYVKDFDYWGHTNWDVVFGDLSKFLPDKELSKYDIWADDVNNVNGVFTFYKNDTNTNNAFRAVENWEYMFVNHDLYGFDERYMIGGIDKLKSEDKIKFGYPPYYFMHSHDRYIQHYPEPVLEMRDGSLFEIFFDQKIGLKGGKEIMWFHFSRTKKYPDLNIK